MRFGARRRAAFCLRSPALSTTHSTSSGSSHANAVGRLKGNIARVFLGNVAAVERVVCCFLARGHLLIEDVPGVGKTVLATALARSVNCSFNRVQLTPDLLPSDILGVSILDQATGKFTFTHGPIFTNILLADEINRTPPRTQAALLEAMNEGTVSIDGRSIPLPTPFMVVATQNPHEYEGTYPLPENQLDRFLMRMSIGYPSPEDELRVLDLRPANHPLHELAPVVSRDEVIELQNAVDAVRVDRTLLEYVVAIAGETRRHADLDVGVSPRGALALTQAARATAMLRGREYVIPEDITSNLHAVAAHRVIPKSLTPGIVERALEDCVRRVASPA
jgi:MoxR-like ATPase